MPGLRHIAATTLCMLWLAARAQPVAVWQETRHNYGTFHESDGSRHGSFTVTNGGDSALTIVRVQPTCGCTVAQYTREPIAPGESGTVDVTFTPTGRPGPFEKDIYVYTNTTPRRTRLTISGMVVGSESSVQRYYPVACGHLRLTEKIVSAGEVTKGLIHNSTVTAYNATLDTLLLAFDHNTSHLTVTAIPTTVPPGDISTISLFFDSSRTPLWGVNDDFITVTTTPLHSPGTAATDTLELIANVVEDFSKLTPAELQQAPQCSLSDTRLTFDKGVATQTLTITNTGRSNLVIHRVMSQHRAASARTDATMLRPGKRATITVTVNKDKITGNVLDTGLIVITNDPAAPRQQVKVVSSKL